MLARALLLALFLALIAPVSAVAAPDDTATLETVDRPSRTYSVPALNITPVRAEKFDVNSTPMFPLAGHDAFPSLVQAADGTITVAYRHGSDHVLSRDGVLRTSTSTDGGKTFTAPQTFMAEQGKDLRDPSLAIIKGEVWTTWFTGSANLAAEGAWVQRGAGMAVRIDPLGYAAIAAPVRELPDGSVGAVYYGHPTPKNGAERDSIWFARSTDGVTWTNTLIANGQAADRDYQEPWLVVRGSQLIVTHRDGGWDSIAMTVSNDGGATWSAPRKLFGNATGRPNTVVTKSGAIVMNFRAADSRNAMITTSTDGGQTWTAPQVMLAVPPDDIGWTYSDIISINDGKTLLIVASVEIGEQAGLWRGAITAP